MLHIHSCIIVHSASAASQPFSASLDLYVLSCISFHFTFCHRFPCFPTFPLLSSHSQTLETQICKCFEGTLFRALEWWVNRLGNTEEEPVVHDKFSNDVNLSDSRSWWNNRAVLFTTVAGMKVNFGNRSRHSFSVLEANATVFFPEASRPKIKLVRERRAGMRPLWATWNVEPREISSCVGARKKYLQVLSGVAELHSSTGLCALLLLQSQPLQAHVNMSSATGVPSLDEDV